VRGRRGGSRTGTFLVLAGIVGVLGVTFIAGVWTGHNWPVLIGNAKAPAASEPAAGRRTAGERPRPAEMLPALTFYHELTAPLTAPPPPPRKPARPTRPPEPKRTEPARSEDAAPPASTPPASPPPAPAPPRAELSTASSDTRYTIQVAAYNARALAEALRSTLAAAGHEARVVETASGGVVRYRVQVGTFPTREAAREAAGRLAAQRSLSTFVTTR
jgi:cell division protein FtsN